MRPSDPYPPTLTIALEKVETLRYGENPHQPAARYRRPGTTLDDGLFGVERAPLQGKALSYNNVLDAAAAAALGRALRGPGRRHRQAHQPVRRGGTADPARGVGRRARGRPGQRLRRGRGAHARGRSSASPRRSPRSSSRSSSRPPSPAEALEVLATKPNLRVLVDERLASDEPVRPRPPRRPARSGRPAAPSSSRRPTSSPTRPRPGRAPPDAPRPTRSSSTSTSPGAWSAA